jgi:hypothetical protein
MDRARQIQRLDERGQVIGVGVHVVAVPRLAGSAVAAPVMGDAAEPRVPRNNIWSSQASALSGQPWLKTTCRPLPQSL